MRVYHYICSKYGLENIRRKRLKISRLEDLNDPFELLSLELSDKRVRDTFVENKEQLNKGRGILCFSEVWGNPVMWSHYAEKHKGLCLEFEIPDDLLAKITYSRDRLKREVSELFNSNPTFQESAMNRILTTKFSHWKYERERRVFAGLDTPDSDGNFYADFSEQLKLTGVIVGPRSSVSRSEMNDALKFAQITDPIKSFKARLAFKSFRVVKNKDQSLWQ